MNAPSKLIWSTNRGVRICLFLFLVFSLSYYIYRYPLSYNDTSTSPTYTDTPLIFQIAKYAVTGVFILVTGFSLISSHNKIIKDTVNVPLIYSLFIFVIFILKIPFADKGSPSEALKTIFFLPIIGVASLTNVNISVKIFVRIIYIFLFFHFSFDLFQVGNFFLTSRLPALALPGTFFIRFGGLWDDPNSLAIFLLLAYSFALNKIFPFKGNSKTQEIVVFGIILSTLALTISITGFISFIAVTLIHIYKKNKIFLFYSLVFLLLIICIAVYLNPFLSDLLKTFLISKEGSAEGHLDFTNFKSNVFLIGAFGDFSDLFFHESFYIQFLLNFGLPALLLLFWFIFLCSRRCLYISRKYLKLKNIYCSNFYSSIYLFIIGFAIANITLPFFSIFPINFIFWFCVLMSFDAKVII